MKEATHEQHKSRVPAYKQFWPWFVFMIPGLTVVAGFSTLFIAILNADTTVNDEWYKTGLAVNQTYERQERAKALGMTATIMVDNAAMSVLLQLERQVGLENPASMNHQTALPNKVSLEIVHPTLKSADQKLDLITSEPGKYHGKLVYPLARTQKGRIIPETGDWLLTVDIKP